MGVLKIPCDNVDFNFLEYELSLFNTRWISNFFRSWLVFYRFGLVDNVMRHLIEFEGITPWNDDFPPHYWDFDLIPKPMKGGEIRNSSEGSIEWKKFFRYWALYVLDSEEFEVFDTSDTTSMGLGIRCRPQDNNQPLPFRALSFHSLHGFLEIIPEELLFYHLNSVGYPSLYRFFDSSSRSWIYSILFGPLALVNSKSGNFPVGFHHIEDNTGESYVWRLDYSYGRMESCRGSMDTLHWHVNEVHHCSCTGYDSEEEECLTVEATY